MEGSKTEAAQASLQFAQLVKSACRLKRRNDKASTKIASEMFQVSHWYVDSQATVALITKAFAALRRNPKTGRARALQQAMLGLMRDTKRTWHPAYWAPFIVVGEGG